MTENTVRRTAMDNQNRNGRYSKVPNGGSQAAAIIVVGIFLICIIFIFSKLLFSSNSAEAPKGLDTATINTDVTEPEIISDDSAVDSQVSDDSLSDDSAATTEDSSQTDDNSLSDDSSESEYLAVMYVTQYAYLHTLPDKDSENIVCMSPGVEVNVLEYDDSGYIKITFVNIDGPLTGYIYKDYLASYDTTAVANNYTYTTTTAADDYAYTTTTAAESYTYATTTTSADNYAYATTTTADGSGYGY
jgi:hypothetical protein